MSCTDRHVKTIETISTNTSQDMTIRCKMQNIRRWSQKTFESEATNLFNAAKQVNLLQQWYIQRNSNDEKEYIVREECVFYHEDVTSDVNDEDEIVQNVEDAVIKSFGSNHIAWNCSIVFSPTYGVPVFYFRANFLDGTSVGREEVLRVLNRKADAGGEDDDGWDFVSEEEHPVTGVPHYFLHPCQTPILLNFLSDTVEENISPGQLLLSWLSMILSFLPYIRDCDGLDMRAYVSIQKKLILSHGVTKVPSFGIHNKLKTSKKRI